MKYIGFRNVSNLTLLVIHYCLYKWVERGRGKLINLDKTLVLLEFFHLKLSIMLSFIITLAVLSTISTEKIERGKIDILNNQKCSYEKPIVGIPFDGELLGCYNGNEIIKNGRLIDVNYVKWITLRTHYYSMYKLEDGQWKKKNFKVRHGRKKNRLMIYPEIGRLRLIKGRHHPIILKTYGIDNFFFTKSTTVSTLVKTSPNPTQWRTTQKRTTQNHTSQSRAKPTIQITTIHTTIKLTTTRSTTQNRTGSPVQSQTSPTILTTANRTSCAKPTVHTTTSTTQRRTEPVTTRCPTTNITQHRTTQRRTEPVTTIRFTTTQWRTTKRMDNTTHNRTKPIRTTLSTNSRRNTWWKTLLWVIFGLFILAIICTSFYKIKKYVTVRRRTNSQRPMLSLNYYINDFGETEV